MFEDSKKLLWRVTSEVMWVHDTGCALAILLSEEGPQLCDQSLVTQWAIRRSIGIEVEILDLGSMFLGDFSQDFRLLSAEV